MTTPERLDSPELMNGQYTNLDDLHNDLNFLGSRGVKNVILEIDKPYRRSDDESPEYEYMLTTLRDFRGSPPLREDSDPSEGRALVEDGALDSDRVPYHGWITDKDFDERGASVRIVVDPLEVEGMDFSWDGGGDYKAQAIEKMEFVKHLLLII